MALRFGQPLEIIQDTSQPTQEQDCTAADKEEYEALLDKQSSQSALTAGSSLTLEEEVRLQELARKCPPPEDSPLTIQISGLGTEVELALLDEPEKCSEEDQRRTELLYKIIFVDQVSTTDEEDEYNALLGKGCIQPQTSHDRDWET